MWKNFLVVTLRSIRRNKLFNMINMAGLAIGLASAIFILLYVISESSYDKFHERGQDIYRICIDGKMAEEEFRGAYTSPVTAPVFTSEIPEVEKFCRFHFHSNLLMWADPTNKYLENTVLFADSSFFELFSLKLLEGDPATCLTEPNTILLSESKVDQYFPEGDPLGKSLALNEESNLYRVSGVVQDAPRRSHFYYDFICSYSTEEQSRNPSWFNNHMQAFLLAQPGTSQTVLDEKIKEVGMVHIGSQIREIMGLEPDEFFESGNRYGYFAQALTDIHLDADVSVLGTEGYRPSGNRTYLFIFGAIAIFILIIASINFMNLSTARSLGRAKEVSLRKVVGSDRKHLIRQFLFESVFLSLAALVIALVLVLYLMKPFNRLMDMSLAYQDVFRWYMIPALVLLAVLVGLLSGSYPSFVLASFKPIFALKGNSSTKNGTGFLRNLLVIIQFTISIVIIAGTLVIYWQFRFMSNKDLGFDKEQLVVVDRIHPLGEQIATFKEELKSHSSILNVSNSTSYMGAPNNSNPYWLEGRSDEDAYMFWVNWADEDFLETYRIGLAGSESRYFSNEFGSDSSACLINETAVRKYGIENPINMQIRNKYGMDKEWTYLKVIGVVKDHHFASLKEEVAPQIFHLKPGTQPFHGYLTMRLAPGKQNIEAGLKHLDETWKKFTGDEPLQYHFLDESLEEQYAEEKRTGTLTMVFSILAIFIASLGLFGLTLYNSQKRVREIGIRKVLGATEAGIVTLVSKHVVNAVVISIAIALPAAYFITRNWLQDFPYNVGFQPLLFVFAALLVVVIALVTVAVTSINAARTDPAICLHYE
jgi:putative ABC transport system permease protein